MIATGALGIFIGKKLGDKIPELGIKILAASIFLFFGLQKLFQTIPAQYLQVYTVLPFLCILTLVVLWMVYTLIQRRRAGIQSAFITKAKLLHDYYLHMKEDLNNLCLGLEYCCACQGNQCAVGQSKEIVRSALANQEWQEVSAAQENGTNHGDKPFTKEKVLDCLVDTLWLIGTVQEEKSLTNAHLIRNQMEKILLGQPVKEFADITSYLAKVGEIDAELAGDIDGMLRMRKPEKLFN